MFFCSIADLHLRLVSLKGPQVPFAQVAPEKHSWIVKHPATICPSQIHSSKNSNVLRLIQRCEYIKIMNMFDDLCMHTKCTKKLCYHVSWIPNISRRSLRSSLTLRGVRKKDKSFQRWIRKKTVWKAVEEVLTVQCQSKLVEDVLYLQVSHLAQEVLLFQTPPETNMMQNQIMNRINPHQRDRNN